MEFGRGLMCVPSVLVRSVSPHRWCTDDRARLPSPPTLADRCVILFLYGTVICGGRKGGLASLTQRCALIPTVKRL